ncbi:MFS transporter, PAT family, beta-lactamase induction signal transducer AmpG [Rhodoblastus acidophilus]|uniref:MFS transporter, PAT family, beta-lactamase induction signal transducer AmpG n=1 Tax=Rhodoblastus acidophilus TaxID=1074 RepID=A0A212R4W4_RHOAC|nr:MFS transporter [Rhodoblastus acidophilus]PPQ36521.1 MFS transporter [Rhodoblastus acidophilus]RAI16928.1 MFS transporter [Rhodoblastus acidophilus]SNB66945.1 MFS transporter, PAT family, beta-lactamase induction signal transducer AmpG [Rhodoblastus acidophilus]
MTTESPRGKIFADRTLPLMLALGFSSGLPFLLVFSTQSTWLREVGVSKEAIGMISWVALAYSLKFLWAPLLDRFDAPIFGKALGRRRGWMALIQIGVALCLAGLSFGHPGEGLLWTICFSFLLGFCGSTQDITIDGWRIAVAPPERQGALSAASQVGYKIALLCAGAGALYIAQYQSWRAAYLAMACLMVVGFIANLFAPEPNAHIETAPGARKSLIETYAEPLKEFFARNGRSTLLFLLLLALYRLPDFVSGVMANPLYIDLGFSKTDIANITKIFGFGVGLAGIFVGGWSASRFGLMPTLLVGGIAASASHLSLALLAHIGQNLHMLTVAICVENFAGGFAGTALVAFMSSLVSPLHAAAQYALLSSLYALPGKILGGFSGFAAAKFGYSAFFVGTSCIGVPVVALCVAVWRAHAAQGAGAEENSLA